jgi:phosphotransferase system enzyme I (PtsI)
MDPTAAVRPSRMRIFRGIGVSPGVAIGPALVLDVRGRAMPARTLGGRTPEAECDRLGEGLAAAEAEAEAAEADAQARLGPEYAAILAAHKRMIADPQLRDQAAALIRGEQISAEHAVYEVLDRVATRLEGLANSNLAARAADVRDILEHILDHLAGTKRAGLAIEGPTGPPAVLLAHDLTPSQTARLDRHCVLGFATEAGGRTGHTAIVAAGLEIPAVVGLGEFLEEARSAEAVIVDGTEGLLIVDPDAGTLERYRRASADHAARFADLAALAHLPSDTVDGTRVELLGNIEFPGEVPICLERGAAGIGLFRTEFLYLNAERAPSEDEQYEVYSAVIRAMEGRPVTIRTLDLGADKLLAGSTDHPVEPNPYLGLRSIRLSLRQPELFRAQLRAILRAARLGDLRVMFPLISTLGEFRRARGLMEEVAGELESEGHRVPRVPVGAMVEVPAAALMADHLAREVDFFSIGTNDLIQYSLAVDRTNEHVADLYRGADPAVLRLVRMVVEAARPRGLPVNLCGSMGGDPAYTALLVGLGLRQLSMPPHQLNEVKNVVRTTRIPEAEALAREALELDTAEAVEARLLALCPVGDGRRGAGPGRRHPETQD